MDNLSGALLHLPARDTSFAAVSRAPLAKIEAFRKRMHWAFPWVSSLNNDFNYDYRVSLDPDRGYSVYNFKKTTIHGEMPGLSVFLCNDARIYHSYSTYFVGLDIFLPMYHLLDVTPLGRQENEKSNMTAGDGSWIRFHDEYGVDAKSACCSDGVRGGSRERRNA
jgi:predicted dithiol-disulfide oxidoreductase (DUF899 family)